MIRTSPFRTGILRSVSGEARWVGTLRRFTERQVGFVGLHTNCLRWPASIRRRCLQVVFEVGREYTFTSGREAGVVVFQMVWSSGGWMRKGQATPVGSSRRDLIALTCQRHEGRNACPLLRLGRRRRDEGQGGSDVPPHLRGAHGGSRRSIRTPGVRHRGPGSGFGRGSLSNPGPSNASSAFESRIDMCIKKDTLTSWWQAAMVEGRDSPFWMSCSFGRKPAMNPCESGFKVWPERIAEPSGRTSRLPSSVGRSACR